MGMQGNILAFVLQGVLLHPKLVNFITHERFCFILSVLLQVFSCSEYVHADYENQKI